MALRQIFMTIVAVMLTSAVFADNSNVTSKKYVDDFMAGYQDKVPGSGADKLMIYDESPDGIGEKNIVSSLGESTSATDVPNVGAVKAGMDGKQDTINGTAGYVMTGMGTNRPGEVGERAIYGTAVYSNSLVTAETVNTGVTNAVNSSLIRVDANGNPSDTGTLWEINTGLYALGVLPAGYTQLEWIESDGTQYIDTGIKANLNTKLELDFALLRTDNAAANIGIYGAAGKQNTKAFVLSTDAAHTYIFPQFDSKSRTIVSNLNFVLGQRYNSAHSKDGWYYDGILGATWTEPTAFTTSNNIRLFGARGGTGSGANTAQAAAKIWYVKIWDGESLVADFIPASTVENNETVVGMYDTVSGQFFRDAAGGNFTPGPVVAGN